LKEEKSRDIFLGHFCSWFLRRTKRSDGSAKVNQAQAVIHNRQLFVYLFFLLTLKTLYLPN